MPRCFILIGLLCAPILAQDELPTVLDDRLKIELVAEHPDIVTPTGIDVDHLGRVFVIESNTHFPPEGYAGHPSDRLLILENTAGGAKADKITVFADGLKFTMSVAVEPIWLSPSGGRQPPESGDERKKDTDSPKNAQPGGLRHPLRVFVATRNEILLLTDTDGDNQADDTKRLVHLETAGNYPHNGLAGFAFDALGNMFFGFGENLGADYQIIGSDGTTLSGGGEGGNLYRCKPDGSKLERWATGFWNPHASCFDAFGRLFTVDNDPDSRPPCRLLHIIPGGDYGYRFRNGRKGTHPFTSWNGEIPGTLPMVAGTGEAPSGIVCYENDGFPEDYLGTLLVGSWGDHRIDQFVLEPKGASFTSKAKPIIQGGENFRPVGLAVAPDGSLYFSDWVLKDYKLHGKGRVWRVSGKQHNPTSYVKMMEAISSANKPDELRGLLSSDHIAIRRLAARCLVENAENASRELSRNDVADETSTAWYELRESKLKSENVRIAVEVMMASKLSVNDYSETYFDDRHRNMDAAMGMYFAFANRQAGSFIPGTEYILSNDYEDWHDVKDVDPMVLWNRLCFVPDFVTESFEIIQCRPPFEIRYSSGKELGYFVDRLDQFSLDALSRGIAENRHVPLEQLMEVPNFHASPRVRLLAALAMKLRSPANQLSVRFALADAAPQLRRLAVQWVGEEKLSGFRPRVEAHLADPTTTPDLFLACLATLSLLDGLPASEFEKNPPTQYIAAMVKDAARPAALRATALRMLPANAPELDEPLITELLSSDDETLRIEAVRTLANSPLPKARGTLLPIAADSQANMELRAEAIAGLCNGPHEEPLPGEIEALLTQYARGDIDVELNDASQKRGAIEMLQLEALRSLRGRAIEGSKIHEAIKDVEGTAELKEALGIALNGKRSSAPSREIDDHENGDPVAGRRVFYSHNGPLCAKCHTVQGRGGQVGPDLTVIARTMDREKLLASILEPSKEISPQFTTWVIETASGKAHTGFILEDNRTGQIKLGTPAGEVIVIDEAEIETREPSKTSVMPEKLHERMTTQELRDLLAFLETLK